MNKRLYTIKESEKNECGCVVCVMTLVKCFTSIKKDRGEIIGHSISGLIFTGVNMTSDLRKALECGASVNLTMGILECPRNHKGI